MTSKKFNTMDECVVMKKKPTLLHHPEHFIEYKEVNCVQVYIKNKKLTRQNSILFPNVYK